MAVGPLFGPTGTRKGASDLPGSPRSRRRLCAGRPRRGLGAGAQLWLGSVFALAESVTTLAASTVASRRPALERQLDDLLARATRCDLVRAVQDKIRRARDQLLTFTFFPGEVEPTNNACERDPRPAVIQRKVTNGYRAMWSAEGEAAIRTAVATERINHGPGIFAALLQTVTA